MPPHGGCSCTAVSSKFADHLFGPRHGQRSADPSCGGYSRGVGGPTAIAGALNPDALADAERADGAAEYVANRLDQLAPEIERGWSGTPTEDGGLRFTRTVRGVEETHAIDGPLIRSADARNASTSGPGTRL